MAETPTDLPANASQLLDARHLSRVYGGVASVQDVSLQLQRGDVLALLGLNGAGKSTTLRMLSGVLTPDAGKITVAGHSLLEAPLEARARLGYLPDQPPLYADQRVVDFLNLAARLRRVPRTRVAERVSQVVEQCELTTVSRRRIAHLSKGFRQRVGLAQALVHKPDVLLLDEPANGLDPQQMEGMRQLITSLGETAAVIFSTHLLGEAQAVCNRVAVLHEGQLVADQPIAADSDAMSELFTRLTRGIASGPAGTSVSATPTGASAPP